MAGVCHYAFVSHLSTRIYESITFVSFLTEITLMTMIIFMILKNWVYKPDRGNNVLALLLRNVVFSSLNRFLSLRAFVSWFQKYTGTNNEKHTLYFRQRNEINIVKKNFVIDLCVCMCVCVCNVEGGKNKIRNSMKINRIYF